MATNQNPGFDPQEIEELRAECREEGNSFVLVEDEDLDMLEAGECEHIQFVGKYKGEDVIYDALIYTLRLHHSSMVYEMAVEQIKKSFPSYVPPEEREPTYKISPEDEEEAETALTELIEEIEENETIKVQEHVETDLESDYGIALDVCLNVEEINDEVIEKFIVDFNNDTISLDTILYSFSEEGEE